MLLLGAYEWQSHKGAILPETRLSNSLFTQFKYQPLNVQCVGILVYCNAVFHSDLPFFCDLIYSECHDINTVTR